jgi:hypothetical protein
MSNIRQTPSGILVVSDKPDPPPEPPKPKAKPPREKLTCKPWIVASFGKLPEESQWAVLQLLNEALLWRGWDDKCHCRAAGRIRSIADIFAENGMEFEQYC